MISSLVKATNNHPNVANSRLATLWMMFAIGCVLTYLAAFPTQSSGQGNDAELVRRVKVAYLYNIARQVDWPANAFAQDKSPFVIAILGEDPLGRHLKPLNAKQADGHKIEIRRFGSMSEYRPVHILYVPSSNSAAIQTAAVQKTRGKPVLVVGESPGYAKAGATLNFFVDFSTNTLGFEINVDAAQRQNLRIPAAMLNLAKLVRDGGN